MTLKVYKTSLDGVYIIEPEVFSDSRGFFYESFNHNKLIDCLKLNIEFVQDNHSRSKKNTLRGLHYQIKKPQGKLIRVTHGKVFDVIVDIRQSSKDFGKWIGIELSQENKKQIWIPEGFAHGFLVLSQNADFLYKTTEYWYPEFERCISWCDKDLNIKWPIKNPELSSRDEIGMSFKDADVFE